MNYLNKTFLTAFVTILNLVNFTAQDLILNITSVQKKEILTLSKIKYQNKHLDSTSLHLEIKEISNKLKELGFFTNKIDSISNTKNTYLVYFSLQQKTLEAKINLSENSNLLSKKKYKIDNYILTLPINKLKPTLTEITKDIEEQGRTFSKAKLNNIILKDHVLFANLEIIYSKKRTINKVIFKGYKDFPKKYLKNYFNIKNKTVFNKEKIKNISINTNNLTFVKQIKNPEVLFTKDSTLIYMYLERVQNNSFDGLLNFATKDDGKLLINGNINLKLNNTFNKGEQFELYWNSIQGERQELKLTSETPYIFNTKFTPHINFAIYKQDSSFTNTKFNSELYFNINPKNKIALSYLSETSTNLNKIINSNIESYNSNFLGLTYRHKTFNNDSFFNDKFFLEIKSNFGKRHTNQNSSNQIKLESILSYMLKINHKNNIFLKNNIGILISNTILINEMFRIGGPNSIRGFNEQSIFTGNYSIFNLEFRHLTSKTSSLYSITDYAILKDNKLLGLGLGYRFKKNNSIFTLNTVFGNDLNDDFKLKNPQLNVIWKVFF